MLQRYSDILNTRDDLTDDQYDEMISWFASVEDWTGEIKDMPPSADPRTAIKHKSTGEHTKLCVLPLLRFTGGSARGSAALL